MRRSLLILVAVLVAASCVPDTEGSVPSTLYLEAPAQVTTLPESVDEKTTRRRGEPADPAVHDLCEWFDAEEITEIVGRAHETAGASLGRPAFAGGNSGRYPPVGNCSWGLEAGARPQILIRVEIEDERWEPSWSLEDGALVVDDRGSVRRQRIDEYEWGTRDVSNVDSRLVAAHVTIWSYWLVEEFRIIAVRLRSGDWPDMYISYSAADREPPLEFRSGTVTDGLLDVVLFIGDELLRRMNWVP